MHLLGGGVGGAGGMTMICDNCGAHTIDANVRQTVCGGPVLCQQCEWVHRDECITCEAYHAEDEALLREKRYEHKHPDWRRE